jgi:anaerobic magnesium-protoporphyrin IX monomethyl ester cyclase
MKVTFISPYISTDCMGIRILAALLRERGHQATILFLPDRSDQMRRQHLVDVFVYDQGVLDEVIACCRGSDLVGITLMTQYFDAAVQLTGEIKRKLGIPVLWGGIHATARPEECLDHADMVCVGEGEISVPEVADRIDAGRSCDDIAGIWVRGKHGERVANGPAPLVRDLDSLPFPRYDFANDMLLWQGHLIPFTRKALFRHLHLYFPALSDCREVAYQVITTRGCPYSCSFCGELPIDELYGKKNYLRRRSVDNILQEIRWALDHIGPFGEICFCDDTFLARPLAEIEEFASRYRSEIGLPFYCLVSPSNVTEQRTRALVEAGLAAIGMGIQSGSDRILSEFNRASFGNLKQVKEAIRILDQFRDRLTPYYDFIHEYAYENDKDLLQTLELISSLPKKARIRCYSLVPYPGTGVYERSKNDGMIIDDHREIYSRVFGARRKPNYLNFLIDIAQLPIPRKTLKLLIRPKAFAYLGRPAVGKGVLDLYIALKKLKRALIPNMSGL